MCVCVGGLTLTTPFFGDHSALTYKIGSPLDSLIPKSPNINSLIPPTLTQKMYGNLLGELIAVAVKKIQCAKLVGFSL